MNRCVINADDCGYNSSVNQVIEIFIRMRKISSTSVMANMGDILGAKRLYDNYKKTISFGFHMNLTEGEPILYSQLLLDYGFYVEINDRLVFNGQAFRWKILPYRVLSEIRKEIIAQINVIRDNGIEMDHFDSHHHYHTSLAVLPIIPQVIKESNCKFCRRIENVKLSSNKKFLRDLWAAYIRNSKARVMTTDFFTSFSEYIRNSSVLSKKSVVVELMCHPGGKDSDEDLLMTETNYSSVGLDTIYNFDQLCL